MKIVVIIVSRRTVVLVRLATAAIRLLTSERCVSMRLRIISRPISTCSKNLVRWS